MKLRFPLYAKILLWFFMNLVLFGIAILLLVRAQFHYGFDWMLAAGAGERIQAISDVILGDLNDHPRAEWDTVLARFDAAYRVHFLVFRLDGTQLAGETNALPTEVQLRLREGAGPPGIHPPGNRPHPETRPLGAEGPGPGFAAPSGLGPSPPRGDSLPDAPPARFDRPRGPYPKFIVRTSHPVRYWLVVRAPMIDPERPRLGPLVLAVMSHSMSAGGLFFDLRPWLALMLGAAFFSALLWAPLVRSITHSIAQMTQATRQIAEGRFEARTDETRRDELGSLGQSINRMAERLSGFVTGQRRFLGDVAHELCSPLARIQLALGILEQRADEGQAGYVNDLREEVQHMSGLVNELLSFSKASLSASTIKLKPVRVREAAQKAVGREAAEGVQIGLGIPEDLCATADPELLARALSNLLRNAVRYAGRAGPITISGRPEGNQVVLSVADCGPGVPEAELAQILDPFYRLDPSRDLATGGAGLGLAIVKTCVESCHGTVTCRNRQPTGLEVTIRLEKTPGADAETATRTEGLSG